MEAAPAHHAIKIGVKRQSKGPQRYAYEQPPVSEGIAGRWRKIALRLSRESLDAAAQVKIRREQSFGAKSHQESSRIMMSTHCSLLMSIALFRMAPMTSAFVSALIFFAGIILGYALRTWRTTTNEPCGTSRRTARPTPNSTFGHARRAF